VLVSCFLLFLCFRKVTQEIFSELDETKAEPPNIYRSFQKTEEEMEGATVQPHPRVARPAPGPRPMVVRPPGPPPDASLLPIYSSQWEKPRYPINFRKIHCDPSPSLIWDREGLEALPGTLPERGITTGGLLHRHACFRCDEWVVYLGLWVHSSS
jgi:hypothetical protein